MTRLEVSSMLENFSQRGPEMVDHYIVRCGNSTAGTAVQETGACRHHGDPIKDPSLKPPNLTEILYIEGLKKTADTKKNSHMTNYTETAH